MHTQLPAEDIDRLTDHPPRVEALRKVLFAVAGGLNSVVDLSRIYVDGLENLPADGRFLLVGNHTSAGWPEVVLTPYFVHRHLGLRVRGRLAIAHDYPIVPVGLVGGDDVFRSLVERDGTWERMTRRLGVRLHGVSGVGVPLMRGLGPTLVPRPQRMYLRFGQPIATTQPAEADAWEAAVKERTQSALEAILRDLQRMRTSDPFRNLNPLNWGKAMMPKAV